MSYVKLFSSIVDSTIWRESNATRIVWITMLAKADRRGRVESSLPGLADAARVTLEECQAALKRLSEPDEWSRTKEYDGRRIAEMDGGWLILNYEKHRQKSDYEETLEKTRARVKRHRERRKGVTPDVTPGNAVKRDVPPPAPAPAPAPQSESVSSSSKALVKTREKPSAVAGAPPGVKLLSWSQEAGEIWRARFGGTAQFGRIGKALEELVNGSPSSPAYGWPVVRKAWILYLQGVDDSRYASPEAFATKLFGKLAGLRKDPGPRDEVADFNEREAEKARAMDLRGIGAVVKSMPGEKP